MSSSWHKRRHKGLGVNLWAPEWYSQSIRRFDAEKIAAAVQETGSSICFTFQGFSQDHFGLSFFPTELGPMHRNLREGRDHLEELVQALHARDIKVFAYYSYPDQYVSDNNPDWRQRTADGDDIEEANWGYALCPNSPYRDVVIARHREIAERYDIDGFLALDTANFRAGGCHCRYCEDKHRLLHGRSLPRPDGSYSPAWRDFLEFRQRSLTELFRDTHAALKAAKPDLVFTHNAFALRRDDWSRGESYEHTLALSDAATSIAQWHYTTDGRPRRDPAQIWRNGAYTRFLSGASGKPVIMQLGRFSFDRDYTTLDLPEMTTAIFAVALHGGSPLVIDNVLPDGTVDPHAIDIVRRAYEDLARFDADLELTTRVPFAAVLYSKASHDYVDTVYPGQNLYVHSFEGAMKILDDAKIPVEVVTRVSQQELSRYRVIVLPTTPVLDADEVEAIRAYVADGGTIVGGGITSASQADGAKGNLALSEVFGADLVDVIGYRTAFARFGAQDGPMRGDLQSEAAVPVRSQIKTKVVPHDAASTSGVVVLPVSDYAKPYRAFTYAADVPPGESTTIPVLVRNSYGSGQSRYTNIDLGLEYSLWGTTAMKRLLLEAVTELAGSPGFTVAAPSNVHTAAYGDAQRLQLRLLNYCPPAIRQDGGTAGIEEIVPVHHLAVEVDTAGREVRTVELSDTDGGLTYSQDGDRLCISLERLDLFNVLTVTFAATSD